VNTGDTAWLKSRWELRCRFNVELARGDILKVGECSGTAVYAGNTALPTFLVSGAVLPAVPLMAFSATRLPICELVGVSRPAKGDF
jgi:hypothetical protein